jgi:integrase
LSRRLWDQGEEPNVVPGALSLTVARMGNTDSTRERYEVAFGQLKAKAADFLPAAAIVKDLKDVPWKDAFATMVELSPASRNRVRSALSAFLTVFLGDKFHPFRRDVMKAMGRMEDEATAPREITADEFWKLLEHMDDAVKPSFITLAATGMRIGEYLQCGETSVRRLPVIWIPDGKGGNREASVAPELSPFVLQAIPCRIAKAPDKWRGVQFDARYKRLYKAMAAASEATGIDCSPHFLRHLYAQLGTDTLPSVLVQQGLGHATASMTDRYAKRRTTAKVAAAVGKALVKGKGVRGKVRGASQRKAV